jgi:hypothetical protein
VSQRFGHLQAGDIGGSGGLLHTGCMDTSPFVSHCFSHQHYRWVSYPPYPSFVVFSFLQAVGWPNFTMFTSDVLVGGVVKAVVWLAVVCCIDNCCNCFVSCSTRFVCAEPTIPSACGPSLYLVLSSIERGASGKITYNKPD